MRIVIQRVRHASVTIDGVLKSSIGGGMLVLDLLSVLFFLSDIYAVGTKARLILIFNISILILSAATLCGPAADRGSLAMLAVPSAILLPFMMVRTHPSVSLLFYLLLLLSATLGVFLQ